MTLYDSIEFYATALKLQISKVIFIVIENGGTFPSSIQETCNLPGGDTPDLCPGGLTKQAHLNFWIDLYCGPM